MVGGLLLFMCMHGHLLVLCLLRLADPRSFTCVAGLRQGRVACGRRLGSDTGRISCVAAFVGVVSVAGHSQPCLWSPRRRTGDMNMGMVLSVC